MALKSSDGFIMYARLFLAASAVLASAMLALMYAELISGAWDPTYFAPSLMMGATAFFLVGMGLRGHRAKLSRTVVVRLLRCCLVMTLASLSVGGTALVVSRVFPECRSSFIFGVLASILPYFVGGLAVHFVRAPKPGCCWTCDYDLTGNVSGRCPECGTPIAAGAEAAAAPGPAEVSSTE